MKQYFEAISSDYFFEWQSAGGISAEMLGYRMRLRLREVDETRYEHWRAEKEKQVCRMCGCSHFKPCPGGCYWIEQNLCSQCAKILYVGAEFSSARS